MYVHRFSYGRTNTYDLERANGHQRNKNFYAKDTKIELHKDIFDNSDNDPRIKGVSSIKKDNVTTINKGVFTSPIFLNRIEDKNGVILDEFSPVTNEVLSEEKAYVMLNLMQGVTTRGSGVRLRWKYGFKNQIAGKTGTTQNQSDGWFMGVVPNLVTGVWTGAEDRGVHFRDITLGQGANMALPIWGEYMTRVYADEDLGVSNLDFESPNKLSIELDCEEFEKEQINFDDEVEEF